MDNLIMLPTGKPARKGQIVLCQDGLLRRASSNHKEFHAEQPPQHLYQIAKHRIVFGDHYLMNMDGKGDWVLMEANTVEDALRASTHPTIKKACFLIIASTDPELGLPSIAPEVIADIINSHNA